MSAKSVGYKGPGKSIGVEGSDATQRSGWMGTRATYVDKAFRDVKVRDLERLVAEQFAQNQIVAACKPQSERHTHVSGTVRARWASGLRWPEYVRMGPT